MHTREALLKCVFKELNFQCDALCKLKNGLSLLRQSIYTARSNEINFVHLIEEWNVKVPLLLTFFCTVSNSTKNELEVVNLIRFAVTVYDWLYPSGQKNTHMSALLHMVGLVLHLGNASKMVILIIVIIILNNIPRLIRDSIILIFAHLPQQC